MPSPSNSPSDSTPPLTKEAFIAPIAQYRGEFTPENLVFNANLQEFANRVSIICALETNGKITPQQAYEQIRQLWDELASSEKNLLDNDP